MLGFRRRHIMMMPLFAAAYADAIMFLLADASRAAAALRFSADAAAAARYCRDASCWPPPPPPADAAVDSFHTPFSRCRATIFAGADAIYEFSLSA